MEMNQNRQGGTSQYRAQHKQSLELRNSTRQWGKAAAQGTSSKSEKTGGGHILDGLVCSSEELGLPRRRKNGSGSRFKYNCDFRTYSLLVFFLSI